MVCFLPYLETTHEKLALKSNALTVMKLKVTIKNSLFYRNTFLCYILFAMVKLIHPLGYQKVVIILIGANIKLNVDKSAQSVKLHFPYLEYFLTSLGFGVLYVRKIPPDNSNSE